MSSFSSATVAVDKATSDLLLGPDWTMNIEICDSINSGHWQAKDVVKAVKKRLQHRSAKVQLLSLTLLETIVKNCGDYVHFQVAEKNILGEMVKIVKKKADMQVRDKILVLLDSWQQAFGGPDGKYPQYYWAYEDLRRFGVGFPQRSVDPAPIFTPPATHLPLRDSHAGYGMPSGSSRRLDETMATETENLTSSNLGSMRDVLELLNDMLQAVNPSDRGAVKDDVIVDLVSQCRSNQKKLMQMLTTTGDEELLAQGLELNDSLQSLLEKHDAIASGSPLPPVRLVKPSETDEVKDTSPGPSSSSPAPTTPTQRSPIDEEDDEEDEFAQLARRHSKPQAIPAETDSHEKSGSIVPVDNNTGSHSETVLNPSPSNALVPSDLPTQTMTKDQDLIELLSLTLSSPSSTPETAQDLTNSMPKSNEVPVSSSPSVYSEVPQTGFNSYVVPWAQPSPQKGSLPQYMPQTQVQPQPQQESHPQYPLQSQNQAKAPWQNHPPSYSEFRPQYQYPHPHAQYHSQPQFRPQSSQFAYRYPPPPWAASTNNVDDHKNLSGNSNMSWTPQAGQGSSTGPMLAGRQLQHYSSFPVRGSNGAISVGDSSSARNPSAPAGSKPFVPSYRLFEDLNVFGNLDGRVKVTNNMPSPSLSGSGGHSMMGGGK